MCVIGTCRNSPPTNWAAQSLERGTVKLRDNEKVGIVWTLNAPEGYRWETDEELRTRTDKVESRANLT